MINSYNPENWLLSVHRCVQEWVTTALGTELDEVVMEFPDATKDYFKVPLTKSIVHFEVDAIDSRPLGMGDNKFADNYDLDTQTVNPQYASVHVINYDVGVWTSDKSGGITRRAVLHQKLQEIFGVHAIKPFREATDSGDGGIEILRFTGGRFTSDRINDVPLYRTVNGELEIRCYSRTAISETPAPAIEQISQSPGLTILG